MDSSRPVTEVDFRPHLQFEILQHGVDVDVAVERCGDHPVTVGAEADARDRTQGVG